MTVSIEDVTAKKLAALLLVRIKSKPAEKYALKIRSHSKLKLLNEDLLEGRDIVLLIEHQHNFLVINRINRPER